MGYSDWTIVIDGEDHDEVKAKWLDVCRNQTIAELYRTVVTRTLWHIAEDADNGAASPATLAEFAAAVRRDLAAHATDRPATAGVGLAADAGVDYCEGRAGIYGNDSTRPNLRLSGTRLADGASSSSPAAAELFRDLELDIPSALAALDSIVVRFHEGDSPGSGDFVLEMGGAYWSLNHIVEGYCRYDD